MRTRCRLASQNWDAKNYSLLLEADTAALAPLYGVMSHLPYRQDQPVPKIKTAMRIGRDYRLGAADHANAWERTAQQLGVDPGRTVDRAETILRDCPEAIGAAIDALDPSDRASPKVALLSREMRQRRDDVLGRLHKPHRQAPVGPPKPGATPLLRSASVVCGAKVGPGRTCQRTLTSKPCPLHPRSTGNAEIRRHRRQ